MNEAFPDKLKKIRQEPDNGNKDYAIGSNVKRNDGDDF